MIEEMEGDAKEKMSSATTDSSSKQFSEQLNAYTPEKPKKGQILHGEILHIDDDALVIDIGAKQDAIATRKDLDRLDPDMRESLYVGQELPVYVLRTPIFGDTLLVSIHLGLAQQDWERAESSLSSGELLELRVTGTNGGGITVAYGRLQGFVPNSLIPTLRGLTTHDRAEEKENLIGTTIDLKVIEVIPGRKRLILSGMEAQKEQAEKRLNELEEGQVITGRVLNIVDFGAFLDLDGVDGLLHISEYAHESNIEHLNEVMNAGDELEIKIIDIDQERGRISLSRKALLPGPWEEIEQQYSAGDLVQGEVTNIVDFGAFVKLPEGIEGLIHKSEMENIPLGGTQNALDPGQSILTKILNIDTDRQRMSLSLSQVSYEEQEAWEQENMDERVVVDEP